MRETNAPQRARTLAERLIDGIDTVFAEAGVKAFAYGRTSIFKTCPGERPGMISGDFASAKPDAAQLQRGWGPLQVPLRKAMLFEGADLMRAAGFLSTAHTEVDVDATCLALGRAITRLRKEDLICDAAGL